LIKKKPRAVVPCRGSETSCFRGLLLLEVLTVEVDGRLPHHQGGVREDDLLGAVRGHAVVVPPMLHFLAELLGVAIGVLGCDCRVAAASEKARRQVVVVGERNRSAILFDTAERDDADILVGSVPDGD